jgi:hypothetical protein
MVLKQYRFMVTSVTGVYIVIWFAICDINLGDRMVDDKLIFRLYLLFTDNPVTANG